MNFEELEEKKRAYKEGIRNKILNGEKLTGQEVQDIVFGDVCSYVDEIKREERGRYGEIDIIIRIDKSYYRISYNRGATDFQEDVFFPQIAVKVKRRIVSKYVWEVDNE